MQTNLSKYIKGDIKLWYIIILLAVISIPAVYSASGSLAFTRGGAILYFLLKHMTFVLAGFIIVFITHRLPFKTIINISKIIMPIALFLLVITLIFGTSSHEAKRWLPIGFGFKLQTSDIAKVGLILYVARILAVSHNNEKKFAEAFIKVRNMTIATIALIIPYNLSTGILLFLTVLTIMFVARVNIKKILKLIAVILAIGMIYLTLAFAGVPLPGRANTWKSRVNDFFVEKEIDYSAQDNLAKMAIADGGFFGKMPGNGSMKYSLAQAHSDYIYAFIIEEYGIMTGIIILMLYVIFFYRSIVIARKTTRTFPLFLILGFTLSIVLQAFANMMVAVGLLPVTGQTLPFVSMGGTSMVITGFAFGVILNISKNVDKLEAKN